jgi:hypothetical protein
MRVLQAGRSLVPLTKMPFSPGAPGENIPVFPDIPHLAVIRAPASGNVGILGNVLTGIFNGCVK